MPQGHPHFWYKLDENKINQAINPQGTLKLKNKHPQAGYKHLK